MSFNLGAFAGAAAQSGMNAYQMLENIESQKKRDMLVEMQAQELKQTSDERAALRAAAAEAYGKVGGQDYAPELQRTAGIGAQQAQGLAVNSGAGGEDFDRAANEAAQQALRENAARQNVALPSNAAMSPRTYTQADADAAYLAKTRAINPERALDIESKQLQIASGRRGEKRGKAEDDFYEWLGGATRDVAANPVEGLRNQLQEYNTGAAHKDGQKAAIVPGANGTQSLVFTDEKTGKVISSTVIDKNTANQAVQAMAWQKYQSIPGNFMAVAEHGLKKEQVAAATKTADAHMLSAKAAWANAGTAAEGAKAKNDYWKAAAKKMGQTKADDMKEAVAVQADLIQKADPSIDRAKAELQAANKLLHSAESKAAVITGEQVQKFLDSPEGDQLKYKTENGRKVKRTPEERQAEAIRILSMRNPQTSAIPTGNSNANALLDQALKHATDEDFK